VGDDVEETKRRDKLALALDGERLDRLRADSVAHEPEGRLTEKDLAGLCCLLEPGREVDGIAEDERLARRRIARDHLTGVEAGASRETNAPRPFKLVVQHLETLTHLARSPNGAKRIVLVHDGCAEHRHDRIAQELSHCGAVALEHRLHLLEVTGQKAPERFRIELLTDRRRADEVGEDDRDELAHLVGRSGRT